MIDDNIAKLENEGRKAIVILAALVLGAVLAVVAGLEFIDGAVL